MLELSCKNSYTLIMKDYNIVIKGYLVQELINQLRYETGMSVEDLTEKELEDTINDFIDKTLFDHL